MQTTKSANKKKIKQHLIFEGEISLQTFNAQHYLWGHVKGVPSLFEFARAVGKLHKAASLDDPYADWFLLRIHDAVAQARHQLQRIEKHCEDALGKPHNIKRKIVIPQKTKAVKIQFSSSYSFIAADVLVDFDRAAAVLLAAKFTGLSLDKPFDVLHKQTKDLMESIFTLPFKWQATGVTRSDIRNQTEIAQKAEQLMGKLPAKVLNTEIRALHAPDIKNRS